MQPARIKLHAKEHTNSPVQRLFRGPLDIQVGAPAEFQRPHRVIRAVAAQRSGILEPFRARASFSQVQKKFHSEIRIQNLIGF